MAASGRAGNDPICRLILSVPAQRRRKSIDLGSVPHGVAAAHATEPYISARKEVVPQYRVATRCWLYWTMSAESIIVANVQDEQLGTAPGRC